MRKYSNNISTTIISQNKPKRTKNQRKKNLTAREIINLADIGLAAWMKEEVKNILENSPKERHDKKIKSLSNYLETKKFFVCLSGTGSGASGALKQNETPKEKRTQNHKTNTENLFDYAYIIKEKRNAVTHNNSKFSPEIIEELNKSCEIKLTASHALIKYDTIGSIVRFYSDIVRKMLLPELDKRKLLASVSVAEFNKQLRQLFLLKKLNRTNSTAMDRWNEHSNKLPPKFTCKKYETIIKKSPSTAARNLITLTKKV